MFIDLIVFCPAFSKSIVDSFSHFVRSPFSSWLNQMFLMKKNCLQLFCKEEKPLDYKRQTMDYVDKQIRQAQERQDRLIVRREEEANRKQLELAAIKEREETARQKEQEETARQTAKEQEETKRQAHAEEEETKRQVHAHSQASSQQDGEGPGQASRVGHRPTLPKLPAFRNKTDDIDSYLFALKHMPLR